MIKNLNGVKFSFLSFRCWLNQFGRKIVAAAILEIQFGKQIIAFEEQGLFGATLIFVQF